VLVEPESKVSVCLPDSVDKGELCRAVLIGACDYNEMDSRRDLLKGEV
jgi:hypothetical protein